MRLNKFLNESDKYVILGVNQDRDVCDLCGKSNLKKVVWMVEIGLDGDWKGQPFATGCDCANKLMLYGKKSKKPKKGKNDRLFEIAMGLDLVKKYMKEDIDMGTMKKILNFLSTKYKLNSEIVSMENEPLGIVVYYNPDGKEMISHSLSKYGVERQWPGRDGMTRAKNWLRSLHTNPNLRTKYKRMI